MAKSEAEMAKALVRTVENRLVWLSSFLLARCGGYNEKGSAESADRALDEYQSRFPPIDPEV